LTVVRSESNKLDRAASLKCKSLSLVAGARAVDATDLRLSGPIHDGKELSTVTVEANRTKINLAPV